MRPVTVRQALENAEGEQKPTASAARATLTPSRSNGTAARTRSRVRQALKLRPVCDEKLRCSVRALQCADCAHCSRPSPRDGARSRWRATERSPT